jgi:hypothetical protein
MDAAVIDQARVRENYNRDGFVVCPVFSPGASAILARFAQDWLYGLLRPWVKEERAQCPLETYHVWFRERGVPHETLFKAANRHRVPPPDVERIILGSLLPDVLRVLGCQRFRFWDEGLGWLAFRLIRPGMGDGYPFTKKSWGIAKEVISCWVPVIGRSSLETLALLPGSHLKDFPKHIPRETKFCKDEYRLVKEPAGHEVFRPELGPEDVIFYSPDVLHSEDVRAGERTRFNLELRLQPLA